MLLNEVDKEKIKVAVKLHVPFEIVTYTLPHNKEMYIQEVLTVFLEETNQHHMTEYLKFCLSELLINAKKANTKRIYFKEKNLDINNPSDYEKGMKTCKEDTMNNINYYLQKQKAEGLYVKLVLKFTDDFIKIEIRNNSVLCKEEKERIQEKLRSVKQYKNPKDGYLKLLDHTEGAGLGIIIIILMLQKIGLSKENYVVSSTDKETITSIILPLNTNLQIQLSDVYNDLIEVQKELPVIKENLESLNKTFSKGFDKQEISDLISKDVTLTSLLIKNAVKKDNTCSEISKAINLFQPDELKQIFNVQNQEIRQISRKDDVRNMWNHSYKVAFYAYNLAKNFNYEKIYSQEELYLIALLHDIECILLDTATQKQKEYIQAKCKEKESAEQIFKMIENDFGHGKVGCSLTQKWGLSEKIYMGIKYHNNPELAPDSIKNAVYLIHLADIMQYYDEEKVEFYQINENIRKLFKIDSEDKLKFINEKIKSVIV